MSKRLSSPTALSNDQVDTQIIENDESDLDKVEADAIVLKDTSK